MYVIEGRHATIEIGAIYPNDKAGSFEKVRVNFVNRDTGEIMQYRWTFQELAKRLLPRTRYANMTERWHWEFD